MPEQARACHYVEWSGKEVALPPLPPLRTGRETFASSGSSRTKAPRERSRYHTMCHLYDTRLQPPRLVFTLGPVNLSRCAALPEDAHMDKSTFICFSSYEGSTGSLVTNDLAGSRPACAAGLKPQPLSVRLQDGLGFLQRSSARHSHSTPCGAPASMRRNVGFTMFHSNSEG